MRDDLKSAIRSLRHSRGFTVVALTVLALGVGSGTAMFQVQPNDVWIFVAALGVLACAGLLASALPARRAASVDPLIALRSE